MNIKSEVLKFFEQKSNLPGNSEKEKLNYYYLDEGLIDSMEMVEMIVHFENLFQVFFTPQDIQSDNFRTPGGLISIIENFKKSE